MKEVRLIKKEIEVERMEKGRIKFPVNIDAFRDSRAPSRFCDAFAFSVGPAAVRPAEHSDSDRHLLIAD